MNGKRRLNFFLWPVVTSFVSTVTFCLLAIKWLRHSLRKKPRFSLDLIEGITKRNEIILFQQSIKEVPNLAEASHLLETLKPDFKQEVNIGKANLEKVHYLFQTLESDFNRAKNLILLLSEATVRDWIDQAILACAICNMCSAKTADGFEEVKFWLLVLRAAGIRTATDLQKNIADNNRLVEALQHTENALRQTVDIPGNNQARFTLQQLQSLSNNLNDQQYQQTLHLIEYEYDKPLAPQ